MNLQQEKQRHFGGNFQALLLKHNATNSDRTNACLAKKQLKAYLKGHSYYTHGINMNGTPKIHPTPTIWK
jgi:hypothetical protein